MLIIRNTNRNFESGQVVLILLLVMTVALAIGLSVVQRSLTDVSSSTKTEQSSRAFSAAEAGIEKALLEDRAIAGDPINVNLSENNSSAKVTDSGLLPSSGQALEFPAISKEEIIHMWLSKDDNSLSEYYKQTAVEIYWGDIGNSADKPALELNILSQVSGNTYKNKKIFLDPENRKKPNNAVRIDALKDGVSAFDCPGTYTADITTSSGSGRKFLCKAVIGGLESKLILMRGRMLYAEYPHPIAVKSSCNSAITQDCSFPPQVKIIKSSGTSGGTQRTIQLFQIKNVVPFYFDYAVFSSGELKK